MAVSAPIYLDHSASAPLLPGARQAIIDGLELVGNGSSVHKHGREVRRIIENARTQISLLTGADMSEVVFTGSATEAINQAIKGCANGDLVDEIVVSAVEHKAVIEAAQSAGLPVRMLGATKQGQFDMAQMAEIVADLGERDALFCLQSANNETGVVQPLDEAIALLAGTSHLLFVDAVQSVGKLPLAFFGRDIDMACIASHKIGGPQGAGALLVKEDVALAALVSGGGQEKNRRGGTEAAALIAGFGAAAVEIVPALKGADLSALRDAVEAGILAIAPEAVIFGREVERLEHVVCFAVTGMHADTALIGFDLDGVSLSSGSACSSGTVSESHVLAAMGAPRDLSGGALRVSLGWTSNMGDVAAFLGAFEKIYQRAKAAGVAA